VKLTVSFCHQCLEKIAKVKPVKGGYIVECPCGNKGLNTIQTISGALASWSSGHQLYDKENNKKLEKQHV